MKCINCKHKDLPGDCEICEECMSGLGRERKCFEYVDYETKESVDAICDKQSDNV